MNSEQPTPGLEFVLGNTIHLDLYDTIVMANLGYFQLKATPGAFTLRLREGRSKDIYFIHRLILFIILVMVDLLISSSASLRESPVGK